jgi:tetratricopeptide (TPR) repeat protein
MPTVCIITATLNRPSLAEACKSVDNQTFTDWHHYVIGDGVLPVDYKHPRRTTIGFTHPIGADEPGVNMPDGTPNPILRWALQYLALGDFVCFLDDDNIYRPNFIEVMLNALDENPKAGIAVCALEDLRYRQNIDGYPEMKRCDNSGFLARSHLAKQVGFPRASPERSVVQDYEFIKLCADRYGWVHIPEQLAVFGLHPNTPSLRGHTKVVFSWALPVHGVQKARQGQYEEAINVFLRAIEIDPCDAWTHWQLGEAYFLEGNPTEGFRAWKHWQELIDAAGKMSDDWIQYCYALVCRLEDDVARSETVLMDAIQQAQTRAEQGNHAPEDFFNLAIYSLLARQADRARLYCAMLCQQRLDSEIIGGMIWDLRVLQATELETTGVAEMFHVIQDQFQSPPRGVE